MKFLICSEQQNISFRHTTKSTHVLLIAINIGKYVYFDNGIWIADKTER